MAIIPLTKQKASDSLKKTGRRSLSKGGRHLLHEGDGVIGQFGDLSVEGNRIALIEAMVLSRVLPFDSDEAERLEAAFATLGRSTMHDLVATAAKIYKAHSEPRGPLTGWVSELLHRAEPL